MLNSNINESMVPMYREPHLQRKSDQCAYLWKNWYNYKYGLKDEEKAKEYRELWGKCIEEHTKMCDKEIKTNHRYTRMESLNKKIKK